MTARLLLSIAVLASPAAADTWIVAADGSGDFVDLQDAIDSASQGDTLIVRGKQVTHGAVGPAPFEITKPLTIRGNGPAARILGADSTQGNGDATALIIDASAVVLEDLTIRGGRAESWGYNGADGVRVRSCGALRVERCTIIAGHNYLTDAGDSHPDFQEGLDASGSDRLVLRDCTIRGGKGAFSWGYHYQPARPSDGGAGLVLGGDSALIERCNIEGGAGGDCVLELIWPQYQEGSNGGDGIDLGACDDALVIGGSQRGGAAGEYRLDPKRWRTWLGKLLFDPGVDGLAIDGGKSKGRN